MLRHALAANAAFSTLSGIMLITAGGWLDRHIPAPAWLWPLLGIGLLAFATVLIVMSRNASLAGRLTPQVVAADVGWIVLTTIALVWRWPALSTVGAFLIVDVNLVVAVLAWLQWRGWRRLRYDSARA